MRGILKSFKEITRYPSAIVGLIIICGLVLISIYTIIAIPYDRAVYLWRGSEEVWYNSPKNAHPTWINWFRREKLPETLTISSKDTQIQKDYTHFGDDSTEISFSFIFDYRYDYFPTELSIFFTSQFTEKLPHVSMTWLTPDGREIRLSGFSLEKAQQTFRFSQDVRLERKLKGLSPEIGLFADPDSEEPIPLQGTYELQISGITFEEGSDLDAEFVLFGQVSGIAGTDNRRRDLSIALLWGTPIALTFGLIAAVGTTVITMIIAAIGVWYGSWLDELIQRITSINLILPALPILIMVGTFYSRSIWLMLGMVILLNIFSGAVLTYRAMFLQVKQSAYVEAAQAYGASNTRIVFAYLIPRIVPLLIPQFVIQVPTFVFLEAALAVLGLGDPTLPTWGKIINEAYNSGALYVGQYYWIMQPSILLMVTGLAFALVGYSVDRIFNPRLRSI